MTFPGRFADSLVVDQLDKISLSFLVEDLEIRRGGVAPNIALRDGQPGAATRSSSARVGPDFADYRVVAGAARRRHRRRVHVSELRHTARFVCTTDSDHAQIASFYAGAMSEARDIELGPIADRVGGLDLVVISANDPEAMLRHTEECRTRGFPFAADPSPAARLRWTAPAIRQLDRRRGLPVHQRVRGRADRAEDRLDRRGDPRAGRRPGHHARAQGRAGSSARASRADPRAGAPARSARSTRPASGDAFRAGFLAGARLGAGARALRPGRLDAGDVRHRDRRHPGVRAGPSAASSSGSPAAYGAGRGGRDRAAPALPASLRRPPRAAGRAAAVALGARTSTQRQPGEDLVGVGADLEPGTLLAAYRARAVPDGPGPGAAPPLGWWSPDPRGRPAARRPARVAARCGGRCRRFEIRVDTAFDRVVAGLRRPRTGTGGWITPAIVPAYAELHRLGWAHSRRGAGRGRPSWPAASTASRSVACSRGSRCSTARGTPRRSPWSGWSSSCADGRRSPADAAARRPVAHRRTWSRWASVEVPRGGRTCSRPRRAPWRCPCPQRLLEPALGARGTPSAASERAPCRVRVPGAWSRVAGRRQTVSREGAIRAHEGSPTAAPLSAGVTGAAVVMRLPAQRLLQRALPAACLPKARHRERQAGHRPVERLVDRRARRRRPRLGPDPLVRRRLPARARTTRSCPGSCATTCRSRSSTRSSRSS